MRESGRYLLVGREGAGRPDPVQAAWLYAQMVRWGQTALSPEALKTAMAVFRPDLYDAALGRAGEGRPAPPFGVGAPWNSIAVDLGIGHILHFVSDILVHAAEKVLAVRQVWADKNPDVVAALTRAAVKAAEFIEHAGKPDRGGAHPCAAGTDRRRR